MADPDLCVDSSIYQSDGLCYDFCLDEYAFAVVQGSECWCSNYVPGTTSSTSDCNTPCPGYPDDTCGGDSLYGYMSLTLSPSGTKGAATTSSTSTSTSSEKVSTRIQSLLLSSPHLTHHLHAFPCALTGNPFDFFSMLGNYFDFES